MTGTDEIDKAYEDALQLAFKMEDNFLALARKLRFLQDHNPNLFKEVCFKSGTDSRKAYYLTRISRQIEKLRIPDQQLIDVGWTKVEVIGPHLTKENWKQLVMLARENTVRNLKIVMEGGKPVPGTRCVLLYFKPRQYEVFAKAILQHGGHPNGQGLANTQRALLNLIKKATLA
jgi:hypothetical protein